MALIVRLGEAPQDMSACEQRWLASAFRHQSQRFYTEELARDPHSEHSSEARDSRDRARHRVTH